ncbi:MAG: glutathione peroxidase [Pseudomonadota bacterium]
MVRQLVSAAAALGFGVAAAFGAQANPKAGSQPVNWSAHTLTSIDGTALPPNAVEGRVVLLVNTASRCAFTPQYAELEALHQRYQSLGLTVLGVPSNDFGGQEPGSNQDIAAFCGSRYNVSFPMLEKVKVTGTTAHPLYRWAREAGGSAAIPAWNFHKILVGRDGQFITAFPSFITPSSARLTDAVERAIRTPSF